MISLSEILIPIAHAQEAAQSSSPTAVLGLNVQLFIAQLINFGIILFILWKWAFKPIAARLQHRSEAIEKSLSDAERIAREKEEFEKWRHQEITKARQEAQVIMTKAQDDAGKTKDQIMQQAKKEQQKLVDQAKKQIEMEKTQALQSAKSELANLVTLATEKVIRQKLDEKKDAELIKQSLGNLQ